MVDRAAGTDAQETSVDRPVAGIVSLQNSYRVWEHEQIGQVLAACRQPGDCIHYATLAELA